MKSLVAMVMAALVWLGPTAVQAHLSVTSHTSRHTQADQKVGPCGAAGSTRGTNIHTFMPGETVTLTWDEYIPHPGWFRVSFDQDGQDDFVPPVTISPPDFYTNDAVLMDEIAMHETGGGARSADVTLPMVECDNCTLQIIQIMLDKPPYDPNDSGAFTNDIYYACLDIVISGGGAAGMGGAGVGAAGMGAGTGAGGTGAGGMGAAGTGAAGVGMAGTGAGGMGAAGTGAGGTGTAGVGAGGTGAAGVGTGGTGAGGVMSTAGFGGGSSASSDDGGGCAVAGDGAESIGWAIVALWPLLRRRRR